MISTIGDKFVFKEEDHSYWLGEKRLLSVSEIIQGVGLKTFDHVDPEVLARAADRGRAVHAACQFQDEGCLDLKTVSYEIDPYLAAWEEFKKDTGVIINQNEVPKYHATLGYAGTADRVVVLGGQTGIIDLKTYKPDAVTGVQLAAYSLLWFGPQRAFDAPKRWGLWLKDTGKYDLKEFQDRGDESVFLSALTIAKFKGEKK